MDLHAPQIQGFFDIPVDNIYSISIFKKYFENEYNNNEKYIIISPDIGGMKRSVKFGKIFNVPVTIMHKQRDYSKISAIDKMNILGDYKNLKNKIAIICDDICDSGGTLIKCINLLESYGVKEVWCFITHGIFSEPAIESINNCKILTRMVVINTLPQDHNIRRCNKIIILDCSELLANIINCLNTGDSISSIFLN
jgi:ribose-phosphate pyrophosphokinase